MSWEVVTSTRRICCSSLLLRCSSIILWISSVWIVGSIFSVFVFFDFFHDRFWLFPDFQFECILAFLKCLESFERLASEVEFESPKRDGAEDRVGFLDDFAELFHEFLELQPVDRDSIVVHRIDSEFKWLDGVAFRNENLSAFTHMDL